MSQSEQEISIRHGEKVLFESYDANPFQLFRTHIYKLNKNVFRYLCWDINQQGRTFQSHTAFSPFSFISALILFLSFLSFPLSHMV